MTAVTLISNVIQALSPSDLGTRALEMMADFHIRHLPVVENGQLLGLVSEDDLLNFDAYQSISSYNLNYNRPYILSHFHIYEVLRLMTDFKLSVIPVVDKEDQYLGLITQEDLFNTLGAMGSFTLPGSIIVLEMNRKDYSLAKISGIIEQENAAVISTHISSNADSTQAEVTLKVNKKDVGRIVASLERFDYQVKASFHESDYLDTNMKERYESFMFYLKV